ncbi:MAG: outer membrane protein [Ferruginibacter sp.]|nr:outer membrane protein [Ferruginibacter sp.]
MKRSHLFAALFFATAIITTSCDKDDDNNNTTPSATDRNFMTSVAYANVNEIDFAQLALTKSANDSVKNFAQMMITDHTNAKTALDSLGSRYAISLPAGIDSAHSAMKTQLMALSGYGFDTAYMNGQINDHNATISLFQNEVNSGNNSDIKNYATRNLPNLQMHKQHADSVRASLD